MRLDSKLAGLCRRLQQFLLVREIRVVVSFARYFLYAVILRRSRTYSGEASHLGSNTRMHNLNKIVKSLRIDNRIHLLARPLCAISYVATQLPFTRILSIGPRAEGELLALAGYGFSWPNIVGLDLNSYSPKIDMGDMHAMPYEDSSFDAIVCGWTLGYSDNRPQALREMVRVLRPGGILAIGESYHKNTFAEDVKLNKRVVGSKDRINELESIVGPIKDNIDKWYFQQNATREDYEKEITSIVGVFSVTK